MSRLGQTSSVQESGTILITAVTSIVGFGTLVWVGAWVAATVAKLEPPRLSLSSAFAILTNPADPTLAWDTEMPGPVVYWVSTSIVIGLA